MHVRKTWSEGVAERRINLTGIRAIGSLPGGTDAPHNLSEHITLVSLLMKAVAWCGAVDQSASTWYSPSLLGGAERVAEARFLRRLTGGPAEIFDGLVPAAAFLWSVRDHLAHLVDVHRYPGWA